jgi:hypothetical protein
MDSASQFLFGLDVKSLSFPLPRPGTGEVSSNSDSLFVQSFVKALHSTAFRLFTGTSWPLLEMHHDVVAVEADKVRAYLDPIVDQALAQRKEKRSPEEDNADEHDTLLSHLAASTDGMRGGPTTLLTD